MNKKMMGALAMLLALGSATAAAQIKPLELEEIAKPIAELRLPVASLVQEIDLIAPDAFLDEEPDGLSAPYQAPAYDD